MKEIHGHIILLLAFCFGIQISNAQNVALYYNSKFTQIDEGNLFAEGSNLKLALNTLPYGITEFNSFNVGTLSSAMGQSDLIVIPELERGDLFAAMNKESKDYIKKYVSNGGGLIICGVVAPNEDNTDNAIDFLNGLFGFSLESKHFLLTGTSVMNPTQTSGTHFENLDTKINNNNSTSFITNALPNGASALYSNMDNPSETTVAMLPFGKGKIIYLGWGWWNAIPVGTQDGGWMDILDASIQEVACMGPEAVAKSNITLNLDKYGVARLTPEMMDNGSITCSAISIMDVSPSKFSCDNVGENEVIFTITDIQGRQSAVKTIVKITDTNETCQARMRDIVGNCMTPNGEYIDDVEVSLFDNGKIKKDITKEGIFEFESLLKEKDYQILPKKVENCINGISTYDIVLLENYILTGKTLSPYSIIAGDVDHSGEITVADIVQIRKLILGIDKSFEFSNSWRFIPSDIDPKTILDAKGEDVYNVNDLMNHGLIELIGIKMGDVSGNAIANANQTQGRGTEMTSTIKMQNITLEKDEIKTIDFYPGDFKNKIGLQLALEYDTDDIEVLNIEGGQLDLKPGNFNLKALGKILISYTELNKFTVSDEPLFSLEIQARKRILSGEVINEATHADSEVYGTENGDVSSIQIETVDDGVEKLDTAKVVYQNKPNPFTAYTEISFYTPQDDYVELYVFNEKGEFLFGKKGDFTKGTHTVFVDGNKFTINGVYFYKIVIGKFSQTKRMVRM